MVKEVALNTITQIILLIVNIFLIPSVTIPIINKHNNEIVLKEILLELEKNKDIETTKKIAQCWNTYAFIYNVFYRIKHWIISSVKTFIGIVILFVTFNHPKNIVIKVGKGKKEEELNGEFLLKGDLYFNATPDSLSNIRWLCPVKATGVYLAHLVKELFGSIVSVFILSLILPNTFSSIVSGVEKWVSLQKGTPNITYFIDMYKTFIDIIWNRLIVCGFNENAFLLIGFIVLFVFVLSDSSGEELLFVDGNINYKLLCIPWMSVIFALFNIALAVFNPSNYSVISYRINAIGMIFILILILNSMAMIFLSSTVFIVKLFFNKIKNKIMRN